MRRKKCEYKHAILYCGEGWIRIGNEFLGGARGVSLFFLVERRGEASLGRVLCSVVRCVRPNKIPTREKVEKVEFGGERSKRRVSTPPFGWDGNFQPLH